MAKQEKKPIETKVKLLSETEKETKKVTGRFISPFFAIGRYFKGSWQELRKVRWTNRKSTWGMTAAVIFFTIFFVGLIISLDWVFNQLFKLVIK